MEQKYWVPALERANLILSALAKQSGELRMTELCDITGINKSSIYSLLRTMEALEWVKKDQSDAYSLGAGIAFFNTAFKESERQNVNLMEHFLQESSKSVERIGETFQLSVLDGREIIYLAKQEGSSLVKLESKPGMRFPAHATAMGKMLLAMQPLEQLERTYPDKQLTAVTTHTTTQWNEFVALLAEIRSVGHAFDLQEVIQGICCVAAPVLDASGQAVAAISTSMLKHAFDEKREEAIREIKSLAKKLSIG